MVSPPQEQPPEDKTTVGFLDGRGTATAGGSATGHPQATTAQCAGSDVLLLETGHKHGNSVGGAPNGREDTAWRRPPAGTWCAS